MVVIGACGDETLGTPTLRPTRVIDSTPTPIAEEIAKARVSEVFTAQVAAIRQNDWSQVYESCTPQFRAARDRARYIEDAIAQFARDGYSVEGFEARNVEPFVRSPDRIRVRWDAFQDGFFVRTEEIGQTYIFTQGDWFDDGAWCR